MEAINMAKAREALVAVKELFDGGIMFQNAIRKVHRQVNEALAAPARNCDVGSVKEQCSRHMAFCNRHPLDEGGCHACPCIGDGISECTLNWAQLPCEESGVCQ